MKNLVQFCVVLCLLYPVTSLETTELKECGILGMLSLYAQCMPTLENVKNITAKNIGKTPTAETVKDLVEWCNKAQNCFGSVKCKDAHEMKVNLEKRCNTLNYLTPDNQPCLNGFFKEAYVSKFSNQSSCYQSYAFSENDLSQKRVAYTNGKPCFINYVEDNCKNSSIEYFSNNHNYEVFAETISTKPVNSSCSDPHFYLNAFQCKAISEEAKKNIELLSKIKIQPDDPRVALAIKICRDTEACMNVSCVPKESQAQLSQSCSLLEMVQSNFGVCLSKLMQEKPDLSRFECLGGLDFFSTDKSITCEKFNSKRECVKTVMADVCGSDAVEDYDRVAKKVTEQFECKDN